MQSPSESVPAPILVEYEDNDASYRLLGQQATRDSSNVVTSPPAPHYADNDSNYRLPALHVNGDSPETARPHPLSREIELTRIDALIASAPQLDVDISAVDARSLVTALGGTDPAQPGRGFQLAMGPVAFVMHGGRVAGTAPGYSAVPPPGVVGGPPGYDIRTDMPEVALGYPEMETPSWVGSPPTIDDLKDLVINGLGTIFPISKPLLGQLTFKAPSEILGDNLKDARVPRPTGSEAHQIIPEGVKDERLQNIRDKLAGYGIGINDAVNGVYLPGPKGDASDGSYLRSLHNSKYYDQLQRDFARVQSREEAIEVLGRIREELKSSTYPGSKPVPTKRP